MDTDTLFDLDTLAPAAAAPLHADSRYSALAARATNQTKTRSDAIGCWARSRIPSQEERSTLRGLTLHGEYGRSLCVARVIDRPDGECSLLVRDEEIGDKHLAAEVRVRIDRDGSIVTPVGRRLALETHVPEEGENSGAASGVDVGDVVVGGGFWPERVIGRRGNWVVATSLSGDGEVSVRFVPALIRVPPAFLPSPNCDLGDEILRQSVAVWRAAFGSRIATSVREQVDGKRALELWGLLQTVPCEVREDDSVRSALSELLDMFEFDFRGRGVVGIAKVDLSYGWRIDVTCEGVWLSTGDLFEESFDVAMSDSAQVLRLFDRAEREALCVAGIAPQVSPAEATLTEKPRAKKGRAVQGVGDLIELAEDCASVEMTEAERAIVAEIRALAPGSKIPTTSFESYRTALDKITERVRGDYIRVAARLLAEEIWTLADVEEAERICTSEIAVGYSEELRTLETLFSAHKTSPAVAEVLPGWWVSVARDLERGCHGAVSCTGFHSLIQSGISEPEDAFQRFIAEKEPGKRVERLTRVEDVSAWVGGLSPALEVNCAYHLLSWVSTARREGAVRGAIRAGLAAIGGDCETSAARELQKSLAETSWLAAADVFCAGAVLAALNSRFGPAPMEESRTLFAEDIGGDGDDSETDGADGDGEEEEEPADE